MNSYWLDQLAIFMIGVSMMLTAAGSWITAILPGISQWNRRFFITFFVLMALLNLAVLLDLMVYSDPNLAGPEQAAAFLEYLFLSLLFYVTTVFLLRCCGVELHSSPLSHAAAILEVIFILLLVIDQFTGWFYRITPENEYIRCPEHPVLIAPIAGVMLIGLFSVLHWRNRLDRKYYITALIFQVPLTIGTIINAFVYTPVYVDIGIIICALSMFGIIIEGQVEQYLRQQREIVQQRARIMVLQMRPHFIHNTMTSIYYLCEQDPQKAQQVTRDFNTYLRKNFTAIASEDTIPFTEELEHTRAYLAVEQAQFEDSLFVDYDTPYTRFRLPPLTLQPIVENAIKHGMDPDSEPLHITIETRSTDSGSEITIEDNGTGYEPASDDAPHIALANIRQRLEMMCGGKLTIQPRKGGGTVVRVTIP